MSHTLSITWFVLLLLSVSGFEYFHRPQQQQIKKILLIATTLSILLISPILYWFLSMFLSEKVDRHVFSINATLLSSLSLNAAWKQEEHSACPHGKWKKWVNICTASIFFRFSYSNNRIFTLGNGHGVSRRSWNLNQCRVKWCWSTLLVFPSFISSLVIFLHVIRSRFGQFLSLCHDFLFQVFSSIDARVWVPDCSKFPPFPSPHAA